MDRYFTFHSFSLKGSQKSKKKKDVKQSNSQKRKLKKLESHASNLQRLMKIKKHLQRFPNACKQIPRGMWFLSNLQQDKDMTLVAATIEAEAISQKMLAAVDATIADLRQKIERSKRLLIGIEAQHVFGYAIYRDGKNTKLSYPLENFEFDISGISFDNGRFIQRMREKATTLPK
uniref:Squalene monooxygenase n=1 Tax=Tanacetum cinerariifolium TaxID=118510 RepID=A0A6L2MXV5_TANCI|nr:squalene monooxygenase-like [Tanacetum cinerariifolium]